VCAQLGFGVGFDLCACSVVSRTLGGVGELGRVGCGDVNEVGTGFVVVLDYVDKQLSSSGTCSFPLMSVLVNRQGKWQLFESDKWPSAFP